MARMNRSPKDRFLSHLDFFSSNFTGCWIWTGNKNRKGYGTLKVGYQTIMAHRFSWELYNKSKIPSGLYVCHKCDNPTCVNPDHLFLGTQFDNMQDMVRKGRNSDSRGENNPRANLYDDGVIEIRRLWDSGASANDIAVHFCIPMNTVRNIISNVTWKHLPLCKRKASNRGSHLTENDVREMRRLYSLGVKSSELGRMFKLSQQQAWKVVNYWSFKEVI